VKNTFTLKLLAIMERPPIVCKGGSKAKPTHPPSSWPNVGRELISLMKKNLSSTNRFFASKWQSFGEEDRKNGYDKIK
jgi:hypothetical protein